MNIEEMKLAFQVVQFILTGAIGVYVYLTNKNKVTNDRISAFETDVDKKFDDHGQRITRVETLVGNVPSHSDLADLHEKINEVAGSMQQLRGEFSGAVRTLQLIHETLMERGK